MFSAYIRLGELNVELKNQTEEAKKIMGTPDN
jgi:hypothetical protein